MTDTEQTVSPEAPAAAKKQWPVLRTLLHILFIAACCALAIYVGGFITKSTWLLYAFALAGAVGTASLVRSRADRTIFVMAAMICGLGYMLDDFGGLSDTALAKVAGAAGLVLLLLVLFKNQSQTLSFSMHLHEKPGDAPNPSASTPRH